MPERSERALCVAVLAFGAALRLIQYFGRPSFWIDELALARNIQSFPLARLIRGPLAFQQSAPPGFLALEKIMARFLGAGELSLRVLPLAASIFCLFLFFRLLEQCRLAPPALLGGCILFALAPGLTFYGTELKQYSFDMMFSTLLTLLAIRTLEAENPFGIALIAAGIVAPWFSNQSVFVIAAICPAILATRGRDARQRASATLSVAVLSLSAAGAVAAARAAVTPATRAYFARYWANGFVPHPISLARTAAWFLQSVTGFFRGFLQVPFPGIWLAMIAAGAWSLRKNLRVLLMLTGPAGAALLAAFLGLYPFADRALAFAAPGLLVLTSASASAPEGWPVPLRRAAGYGLAAVMALLASAGLFARHPIVDPEPTRPLVEELARRQEPSDAVYVYYGARQAFSFYGPRAGLPMGSVVLGGCHRLHPAEYLAELDPLLGHSRAWILIAHDLRPLNERALLVDYLRRVGHELSSYQAPGSIRGRNPALFLFDLSRPASAEDRAAASFVPPLSKASLALAARFGCDAGPQAPDPQIP